MWGDARNSYNAPSRRKTSRASHIKLRDPHNPNKMISVPYNEYPAPLIFYRMNRAGLLNGLPENLDISGAWQFTAVMDDKKAKEFEQKFGMKRTAKFRHVPESFGRLLAKVGYGQILCSLDPGDFRPLCLPYILGHKKNVSYIVGGSFDLPKPNVDLGYVLHTVAFGDRKRIFLIAEVRLYANAHTPIYHVVVGDVVGETNVAAAWQKLDGIESVILPFSYVRELSKQPHWLPMAWPLPL